MSRKTVSALQLTLWRGFISDFAVRAQYLTEQCAKKMKSSTSLNSPRAFSSSSKFSEDFILHFPEKSVTLASMVFVAPCCRGDVCRSELGSDGKLCGRFGKSRPLFASAPPFVGSQLAWIWRRSSQCRARSQGGTLPLLLSPGSCCTPPSPPLTEKDLNPSWRMHFQ